MSWFPGGRLLIALCLVAVLGISACNEARPDPTPIRLPLPTVVPIPWVAPTEVCQHTVVPGYRYTLTVPQRGIWTFDWRNSLGNWSRSWPLWFYEAGQTFTFETAFPFHLVWAPDASQGTTFHVVSPDFTPQPAPPCPGG